MVVDMATSKGRLEAEQERHKQELAEKDAQIAELKAQLKEKDDRNAELVVLLDQLRTSQPQVTVHQFFVLSVPKTYNYVQGLDNDGRQFVGHMFHQTMPDDTPRSVLSQVDEMTSLERTDKRLAEAMEKVASRPTTQNNVTLEHVEKKETNIDKNYGPNIEHHGGSLTMPGDGKDTAKLDNN